MKKGISVSLYLCVSSSPIFLCGLCFLCALDEGADR
jgi:hypothetical protein